MVSVRPPQLRLADKVKVVRDRKDSLDKGSAFHFVPARGKGNTSLGQVARRKDSALLQVVRRGRVAHLVPEDHLRAFHSVPVAGPAAQGRRL